MLLRRLAVLCALLPAPAAAQNQTPSVILPPVIVTAERQPEDVKDVPASITPVTADTLKQSGVLSVTEAGIFAPNTVFTELSARKSSSARFRGVGAISGVPGVTTYLDGVPQLNPSSSNIELVDVDQIEFVRGPQSPYFGRNTLGGIVNVTSTKPNLARWTGMVMAPIGNNGLFDVRGNISGPLTDKAAISFAGGLQQRDGFTTNSVTGHKLDSREGQFMKAQGIYVPNANWEARFIYAHERDRDGDYALGDLSAIRIAPYRVTRNFEGFNNRDVNNITFKLKGSGQSVAVEATTGVIGWKTDDSTDLDYTQLPLGTRSNHEESTQFTQAVRFSSPDGAPMQVGSMLLTWQAGLDYFNQGFDQDAVNTFSAFVLSPLIGFPVDVHAPVANIDTFGVGLFLTATLSLNDRADVTAGLHYDHESTDAHLTTSFDPAVAPPTIVTGEQSFDDVSPHFAFGYQASDEHTVYASAARGYKASGFNPLAPAGNEVYGAEHAWNFETGVKSTLAGGKVSTTASLFFINWDDVQLNVPNPALPVQFYTSNAGNAHSRGLEFDVTARPRPGIDVFGSFGFAAARFDDGTSSNGIELGGKAIPYTPDYTAMFGGQLMKPVSSTFLAYGRIEVVLTGAFHYDEANTQEQEAYSIANIRAGARTNRFFAELWLRNAFDTRYVPVAVPYPGFAPSGFIGEMGRPRTFGITFGATF